MDEEIPKAKKKQKSKCIVKDTAGRPHHIISDKIKAEVSALSTAGLPIDQIADYVDLAVHTLKKYYKRELVEGKIRANAAVGKRLYEKAVIDGDVQALKWWSQTQMGWKSTQGIELSAPERSHEEFIRKLNELAYMPGALPAEDFFNSTIIEGEYEKDSNNWDGSE